MCLVGKASHRLERFLWRKNLVSLPRAERLQLKEDQSVRDDGLQGPGTVRRGAGRGRVEPDDAGRKGRADVPVEWQGGARTVVARETRRFVPARDGRGEQQAAEACRGESARHPHHLWHRRHPRPRVLADGDGFPDPVGPVLLLEPRVGRGDRPDHGQGGVSHRRALDLLAGAGDGPGSALGPDRRDVRRGPAPDRRAGQRARARLPGRRPGRSAHHPGVRQALRRLLGNAGGGGTRRRPISRSGPCDPRFCGLSGMRYRRGARQ